MAALLSSSRQSVVAWILRFLRLDCIFRVSFPRVFTIGLFIEGFTPSCFYDWIAYWGSHFFVFLRMELFTVANFYRKTRAEQAARQVQNWRCGLGSEHGIPKLQTPTSNILTNGISIDILRFGCRVAFRFFALPTFVKHKNRTLTSNILTKDISINILRFGCRLAFLLLPCRHSANTKFEHQFPTPWQRGSALISCDLGVVWFSVFCSANIQEAQKSNTNFQLIDKGDQHWYLASWVSFGFPLFALLTFRETENSNNNFQQFHKGNQHWYLAIWVSFGFLHFAVPA